MMACPFLSLPIHANFITAARNFPDHPVSYFLVKVITDCRPWDDAQLLSGTSNDHGLKI